MRNESHRYLKSMMEYHEDLFDKWLVLDDQSEDDSVEIAQQFTDNVYVRPDHIPSFLEHEGKFRQYGWIKMMEHMEPFKNVWVFMIDADEFVYPKEYLRQFILEDIEPVYDGIEIHIPDIHGVDEDGRLWQRTDGQWDNNRSGRITKFKPEGFRRSRKPAACGPPGTETKVYRLYDEAKLFHFGYIDDSDKIAKYERYTSQNGFGHAHDHIDSIVQPGEGHYVDGVKFEDFIPRN